MSMLEKQTVRAIKGIGVMQSDCLKCSHPRRIQVNRVSLYAQGGGDEYYGGHCTKCDTIIWAVMQFNGTLGGFFGSTEGKSTAEHSRIVENTFAASLPPCPGCGSGELKEFVFSEPPKSAESCSSCGETLPAFRDVTEASFEMDVYLYWQREEDMLKERLTRTPRKPGKS